MTAIDENLITDKDKLFLELNAIPPIRWNVKRVRVKFLRKQLLSAQKYKCAYCRRPIVLDEVGYRDIDHILPKSQNPEKNFDAALAKCNKYENRRYTAGYAAYMYNPKNLALSCKICNATKGSFDPLLDRTVVPAILPTGKNAYNWVHPYYDVYTDHINILEGFIYQSITTEQGQYVISACGLDNLTGLSARILDAMLLNSEDLSTAMLKVALNNHQHLDLNLAANTIYSHFKLLSSNLIKNYLIQLKSANTLNMKIQVLEDLRTKLGTGDFIAAVA